MDPETKVFDLQDFPEAGGRMRMNRRERIFVALGAVVVFCLLGYFLVVVPLTEARDRVHDLTGRLEDELVEIKALAAQYRSLSEGRSRLEQQAQSPGCGFRSVQLFGKRGPGDRFDRAA